MNATTRLLLATLALGLASGLRAGTTITPAVVYCKARIMPAGDTYSGNEVLSVTLPPTPGYADQYGNPVTVWNPGNVTAGGVADSWHEGGPGFFNVRNTGNVEAYVYVVALSDYEITGLHNAYDPQTGNLANITNGLLECSWVVWGNDHLARLSPRPTPRTSPQISDHTFSYHLALTTDMTGAAPVWRPLDHAIRSDSSYGELWTGGNYFSCQCSAFLGQLAVGDYQPFDLKFWAPPEDVYPPSFGEQMTFIFTVEAASFPRWEHDR